ncbi:MAG: hypothetical protein Kow0090_11970 [Myxococcota bacterium]
MNIAEKDIHLKLPYQGKEEFFLRYAAFIIPGGIFFKTKNPFPKGTPVSFTIVIAEDETMLSGKGVIADSRPFNPQKPDALYGMAVAIKSLDEKSQKIFDEILEYKKNPPQPFAVKPPDKEGEPVSKLPHPEKTPEKEATPKREIAAPPPAPAVEVKEGVTPRPSRPLSDGIEVAPTITDEQSPPPKPTTIVEKRASQKPLEESSEASQIPGDRLIPPSDEELENAKGPIIGIDLGTTNSCASVVVNGKPMVIPSKRGYRTIPSLVAYNERGKLVVGHVAKSQFLLNPENTVYGAKRLIGRKYNSPIVQGLKKYFTYNIIEWRDGTAAVEVAGHKHPLTEISGFILREIREVAQEFLQTPVQRAVITVPAYYNDSQRSAVREAGKLAGLKVERIINEPTAAALAYGYNKKIEKQRILVYDLGGGTFDASIMDLAGEVYEVVSTGGNNFLGGIDFDNRLVDYFDEVFYQQHGIPLPKDRVVLQRVKFAAENAKIALSHQPSSDVHIPFIAMHNGKPLELRLTLKREKLLDLTEDLVDKTINVCDAVMSAKQLQPKDIDSILLVGGQSRYPRVHEKLSAHFQKQPLKGVHPDEAVALGAALFADSISRAETALLLIDVLPISIGLALPGGGYARIIPRNTPLPCKKSFAIATTRDNQSEISLVVMQGESEQFSENDYLGVLKFDNITPAPRGRNKLNVTFTISSESILKVTAKEELSGRTLTAYMSYGDIPDEVKPGAPERGIKMGEDARVPSQILNLAQENGTKQPIEQVPALSHKSAKRESVGEKPKKRGFFARLFGKGK